MVAKGVDELRVRDETRCAPPAEAPEGAAHVGVERKEFLFAVLSTDAHAVGRVEAEDTRLHAAHCRQQALDDVGRQPSNILLRDDDRVLVCGTGQTRGDLLSVVSGLKPGEKIVSAGVFKLRNKMAVEEDNTLSPKSSAAPRPSDS